MKSKWIDFAKRNYCLLAAPAITAAVLLLAFIKNGILPFGSNTVEYYDMAQGLTPTFYHVWDALHKKDVALWFNWYSGMGVNNAATAFLSFFWVVLLFIKRQWIHAATTLYVLFSFMLASMTAAIFLRKVTHAKPFITTLLSVSYAFCGFSVMYYTNCWQDTVILFPLFMLAWYAVMHKGSILPLVALVAVNLMCGYYIFTLLTLYMFFASYFYIRFCVEKPDKKIVSLKLGAGILLGYGISGVFFLPKMMQTLSSGRFVDKTGFYFLNFLSSYWSIVENPDGSDLSRKIFLIFSLEFPIAIILLWLIENKQKSSKIKNYIKFFALSVFLFFVMFICESTNLLAHFGDYKGFPIRMGYAFSFFIIWGAAECAKRLSVFKMNRNRTVLQIINATTAVVLFCLSYVCFIKMIAFFDLAYVIISFPVIMFLYFVILIICTHQKKTVLDYRICISVLLAEIMVLTAIHIPMKFGKVVEQEHNPAYIATSLSLAREFDIAESKTNRIKTVGTALNNNYGTVMQRATVADWTHLVPSNVQHALKAWGYTGEYTRISDSGGTAFSDALLGVDLVLSPKDETQGLYTLVSQNKKFKLYAAQCTVPYGFVADGRLLQVQTENRSWQSIQNEVYAALSGDREPLLTASGFRLTRDEGDTEYYTFQSEAGKTAYLELTGAKGVHIFVDGERLCIPSANEPKNKTFPGFSNRGIICLGDFGTREVEIKLVFKKGKFEEKTNFRQNDEGPEAYKNQAYHADVTLLNQRKLQAVCRALTDGTDGAAVQAENYTLTVRGVQAGAEDYLVLPLQYSENSGWQAKVNGKKTAIQHAGGILSAVKLENGNNDVEMRFVPRGLRSGAVISALSVLLLALYLWLEKKSPRVYTKAAACIHGIYTAAFAFGVAVIYALPPMYALYHKAAEYIEKFFL